jgi:hypothetical protein
VIQDNSIEIRPVANGYVVFYTEIKNNTEVCAEFVAVSLEETLNIVHDLFSQEESIANMSNIIDETLSKE